MDDRMKTAGFENPAEHSEILQPPTPIDPPSCEHYEICARNFRVRFWPSGTGRQPEDCCSICPLLERLKFASRFKKVLLKPAPEHSAENKLQ